MERDQAVESAVVFWDLEETYCLVSITSHRMEDYLSSRVGAFMLDVVSRERPSRRERKQVSVLSWMFSRCQSANSRLV